jgi:hypothetical protein
MIRRHLMDLQEYTGGEREFRWRGREVTRLEGLTDAVFAFATTLLIVSLEVPRTFTELFAVMQGFFPFLLTFAVLSLVWFQHFRYFRRYGLQDTLVVILNCALLFVVLFYVYPLKFLYTWIIAQVLGSPTDVRLPSGEVEPMLAVDQIPTLLVLAGLGWLGGIVVFALLYWRAYTRRVDLDLNALEVFDTHEDLQNWVLAAAVTIAALLGAILLPPEYAIWSMAIYFLYFPLRGLHIRRTKAERRRLEAALFAPESEVAAES